MLKKEVYVDINALMAQFKSENPTLSHLSKYALWTIFTAATMAQLHFQDENNEPLLVAVMQIHRMAESMLTEEGFPTEEAQLPVFHAVDKIMSDLLVKVASETDRSVSVAPALSN